MRIIFVLDLTGSAALLHFRIGQVLIFRNLP